MNLLKFNILIEATVRIVLWCLFVYFDKTDPFIREIRPEEVWKYQYPVSGSYVPSQSLWMLIIVFPFTFFTTEFFVFKSREDPIAAFMAMSLSYSLNGFLTCLLKVLVGRPRPDFYFRCFPDGTGSDFHKCTGNRQMYLDGRKSFPSGHSSFAFTCMVFMTLYIARKLNFSDRAYRRQAWKLCACILPVLIATLIAISRTCDYHHHYEDVISGSLLGTVISFITYWMYLPKRNENLDAQEK